MRTLLAKIIMPKGAVDGDPIAMNERSPWDSRRGIASANRATVGGGYGTPIIPFGTTAILSIGRAEERTRYARAEEHRRGQKRK